MKQEKKMSCFWGKLNDGQQKSYRKRGMNRDTIKYIAMITMLLNHVSFIFLEQGTVFAEILTAVGYFTAPVMCYFLVEGMTYTRSPKNMDRGCFCLL